MTTRIFHVLLFGACLVPASALPARVYVMSSGYNVQDQIVLSSLAAAGHSGVIGVSHVQFDSSVNLVGFDAVIMQANYNWTAGDMPPDGQFLLTSYVSGGGGFVTFEWTLWLASASQAFTTLKNIFPAVPTTSFNGDAFHHLVRETPDPTINSGLPNEFDIPGDNVAGSETNVLDVQPGAIVFYRTTNQGNFVGLCGWNVGQGRVAQFSQTVGEQHMTDPFGFRLLGNVVEWVSQGAGAQQINPNLVTIRVGRANGGGLAQIADIDGNVMQVCKFIVPNQQVAPITVEIEGTSPINNPSSMQFRTYSKMENAGAFSTTLDLFDWNLNNFSPTAVSTTTISTSYKPVGVAANAPVGRFVGAANKVRARYRIRQTGPSSGAIWCNSLDQAVWFVRP
ncbi:MAG: hypothetical protein KIT11_01605 [Fimbriimonadaceae bacterium]|nr:hypothetical protein [Fimbriimonadaceae bacterium]QYK54934.1 MAG: hypothetical protein KF733_07930 [Fimbriimonadaceae bacterium]